MDLAPPLLSFYWQHEELYSHHALVVPRVGDFVVLPRLTSMVLGALETPTQWRVHAVEWFFPWEAGMGEMRPEVAVHLRRLHPHEWNNRFEPSGMPYRAPEEHRGAAEEGRHA